MSADVDRSGVMLIRAWLHDGQLVARVQCASSSEENQHAQVVVGAAQIEAVLAGWLRELAETAP